MGNPSTGYTFIRVSDTGEQWRLTALQKTLNILGGFGCIKEAFAAAEDTEHLPLAQVCERAALSARGGYIKFDLAGFGTTLDFPPTKFANVQPHVRYLTVEVPKRAFTELAGDPMRVELFAAAWARLCDAQQAEIAYFSEAIANSESFVAEDVQAVEQENLDELVNTTAYWRTYLSPAVVERWYTRIKPHRLKRLQRLPSGAFVLAAGLGSNPQLGDLDAPLHMRFLIDNIEAHSAIPGAERLRNTLRQDLYQYEEIEKQSVEVRYHEKSHENHLIFQQIRADLDAIRAVWAYARRSEGVVGVEQEIAYEVGDGKTEQIQVSVVTNGGRTWVLPTLLYPFTLNEKAWNDEQEGLEIRVLYLLEAAEHYARGGEKPRLFVYFWRDVSQEVHDALRAMGVDVEVADALPILT